MAAVAADEGRTGAALEWAQRALAADPRSSRAHYTLGRVHQADTRMREAEAAYRASIALDAGQARAHNNLGCVLQMQGRLDEAIASFRLALGLDPSLAQAQQNLASLTGEPALLEKAAAGYRKQVAADPRNALACHDLGNVYRELGRMDEAIALFDEAIRRDAQCAEAHYARALALLQMGRWEEAWAEHEWRWRVRGRTASRGFAQPLWDGSDLGGRTLLLHAEQGLGDSIQFARYASLAARRCGALVIECQAPLVRLFASLKGVARVVASGEPLPAFDVHLPFMSLARVFRTTPHSVPWSGAYLQPEPERVKRLSRPRTAGVREAGLVWGGLPQQQDNRRRSIGLARLAPLAALPGFRFVSLQKGEAAAELTNAPPGLDVVDRAGDLNDLADTAAVIAGLDLVISVDTSVAHLAGAMAAPTWVLARHDADWRWLGEAGRTPWYPTARVFRQDEEGHWASAVRRLAAELAALA
jgi:Tfp pilus assembly protein PilF